MPSAFIWATASPRALNSWAASTCRGSSRVASMTDSTSSGYSGDSRARRPMGASAGGDSGGGGAGGPLDHAPREQRAVDREGPPDVAALRGRVLVVVGQQVPHGGERVAR